MPADVAVTPVVLVPRGKLRCYVHPDVLREDTPEEHVRQRVARSLVEEYGYAKRDLHLNFAIKIGSGRRKFVDIAIFPHRVEHRQETISIIVETKREDVRPTDRTDGIDQLKSYMAACISARWGLWVGSELQAFEKELDPAKAVREPFPDATDIPLYGEGEPKRLQFHELVPATGGLRKVFKRCHNYLHTNANFSKEKAFFELLKLIFCKVQDERDTSGLMEFSITTEERRSTLGQKKLKQRIDNIFVRVIREYPYIFPKRDSITLDPRSLAYIVQELQKFTFQDTPTDIKGEAYEEIVGVTSRRDQGAFFTPRNVCDMAVGILLATCPPAERLNLRILDPACGTGGFLRSALVGVKEIIVQQATRKWRDNTERARQDIAERLRRVCDTNLFGIDKLSELVQAAQMNLAMHGDGSSNIYHANSLISPGEWPSEPDNDVQGHIRLGAFDIVVTNPPFGSRLPVDDPHILAQYELARFESRSMRTSMPPEQLFVERCLGLTRPGGRMAIVLPDSILSNPGLSFIRRWVLQRAYVIASIDLPRETFARSDTHTKTSVLCLQRFTEEERQMVASGHSLPHYEIFMAIAEHVGWDLRGGDQYLRTPEGEIVFSEVPRVTRGRDDKGNVVTVRTTDVAPVLWNDLPSITERFRIWVAGNHSNSWLH
jgi:type I restriction enzyme M protein